MQFLDLRRIVSRGGGLDMSIQGYPAMHLQSLASCAANSGAKLTFRDVSGLSVSEMQDIASLARGNVVFVL